MKGFIQALAVATLLQVGVCSSLTVYLADKSNAATREYILVMEQRANRYTEDQVHRLYQRLQDERNADREDTHRWVDRAIELQAAKEGRR